MEPIELLSVIMILGYIIAFGMAVAVYADEDESTPYIIFAVLTTTCFGWAFIGFVIGSYIKERLPDYDKKLSEKETDTTQGQKIP